MPDRFIFRQTYWGDLAKFLFDGEIRAKNHPYPQLCHQTSYQEIVDRRGTQEFEMPNGAVVNDFVPFYFSPITSFTYTIYQQNVPLVAPDGTHLGQACEDDRILFVGRTDRFRGSDLVYCFSDYALNSNAPLPTVETNLDLLEEHVHWDVFDDTPRVAYIHEVGYFGVCKWFHNMASPPNRMTRSPKRMAEFLVQGAVPLQFIDCIIAKNDVMSNKLREIMDASAWNIPIYTKPGCYFG
ncbi:DarT ssDNA thymidine ADP-ribosyltransferase family protein [Roseovarius rhodophyticola]|uniref:DarT ssDNA thymidine ADP-ribosyltransferase family protein n=1 Tax=Roseovarius rhodophyticola TaxID=3080827 RepID=A0ABZ2TJG4_9RHOB|nr:DarT ssDNA thymidine ADP-ribosyltransferase family protein [Roseovarius sp. W115]MDV2930020.1 DarT ssDNA thymidine ADP-ribosyltransferase family protein [Roseovarius sp. W115]